MNIYSEKVDTRKQEAIKDFILQNFQVELKQKQYAFWELKHKEFNATFYNSGKFVIQGKDVSTLLEKLNKNFSDFPKPTENPKKEKEQTSIIMPCSCYIGTDESGKGDFFGPLIIAGVMVDEKNRPILEKLGIKDSKKLKDEQIMKIAPEIQKHSVCSIVPINNIRYNELYVSFQNLNKLLAWGHARVIENILEKHECCYALSDKFGDESLILNALMEKGKKIKLEQRVRAESDIAVAAASIVARANFVQRMADMESYYGCKFPKGCGENVKQYANEFSRQFGKKRLYEVCKAHFKTFHELY